MKNFDRIVKNLDRIEQVINHLDLLKFRESIQDIADALEEDGFELSDIQQFLHRELYEILGDL